MSLHVKLNPKGDTMTRQYELLIVLKPTLVDEEAQAKISFLREVLEKNGAQIGAFQNMGTRKLAYKIEQAERGHYGVFYFTAPPSSIKEVERLIRIDEDYIKFMTVKYEKVKEIKFWKQQVEKFTKKEPTAVVQEKTQEVAPEETQEKAVEVAQEVQVASEETQA